jgi:hypothetical protein
MTDLSSATKPVSTPFGSHRAAKKPLFKPFQAFKSFMSLILRSRKNHPQVLAQEIVKDM